MAFDIASVLKSAAPENGREQIVYLDLDLLDADDANFYSLDGLEDLAANIELIGLQQPLRVRPGAGGRYVIVSGHRRRAACLLIRDGGSEQFVDGIPCIIEYGWASAAMRELRLIYANAATRVMTPAEISLQAERVQTLLYQLKEEGVEFPGRMRDHVAQACKVSKSKLARLHAIRNRLDPELLKRFDRGEIPEETAYQLSRLPDKAQAHVEVCLMTGKKKQLPYSFQIEHVVKNLDVYTKPASCRSHAGGPDCTITNVHICRSIWESYRDCQQLTPGKNENGICCRDCNDWDRCSWACQECKDRRNLEKAVEKEKAEEEQKRKDAEQAVFRNMRKKEAKRLLPLIEAAGLKDEDKLPGTKYWHSGEKVSEIRDAACGEFGDKHFYSRNWSMIPEDTDQLKEWAKTLHCSADYLLGLTEDPAPAADHGPVSGTNTGSGWQTGAPTETGMYEARVGIPQEEAAQTTIWQRLEWIDGAWVYPAVHTPLKDGMRVYRWHKLPEV